MYRETVNKHHNYWMHNFFLSGSRGREKGEFTNLQGISASSNGRVVVADSNNQCIQVRRIDRGQGMKMLHSYLPVYAIIGSEINTVVPLWIWALCCKCLQVFSNDGQFKMRFGVRGRSPGQLQRPTGVTVDMNGDIVVADYDNRWVSIFSSDGKFKVHIILCLIFDLGLELMNV